MKIRSGFVSNSSSSSFTCNVCGTTESGYDASLSDMGMFECVNGHTICDSHQVNAEITLDVMKDFLKSRVKRFTWKKPEEIESRIKEIDAMAAQEVEEAFEEEKHDGVPSCLCPICQLKRVNKTDALNYLMMKHSYTEETLLADVKARYGTYDNFRDVIYPPKK